MPAMNVQISTDGAELSDARTVPGLGGVEETLLIPLWARAVETRRPDGIVRDPYAIRILQGLAYDFDRFAAGWKSQLGIAVRTCILDREVARYLDRRPNGIVVILGCGLDARSRRLDNGIARFVNLDLPDVSRLRSTFFPDTARHDEVASSVLDLTWLDRIPAGAPPLFVAEGLFMYLPEAELKRLISALAERFPGGEILIEALSRRMAARTDRHDVVSKTSAKFVWGIDDGRDMEAWHPGIRFEEEWSYFAFARHRWRWLALVGRFPAAKRAIRIMRLRFSR